MMKKSLLYKSLLIICFVFCLGNKNISAQTIITETICESSSIVLRMMSSYNGAIQWQYSNDQINWIDVLDASADTLLVSPQNSTFFRAVIIDGSCQPTYSDTINLIVQHIPTAVTASAAANPICEGQTLTLTGSATGATAWSWTGPNGFTSTLQNPTIANVTSINTGIYSLTASNSCGSATAVNTASVVVNILPTAVTASAAANPICEGQTLTLTGSATGATAWSWTGPNGFTSTLQNPTIANVTSINAGVYSLTASNSCGSATAANTASVVLNSLPLAAGLISGTLSVCQGQSSVTYSVSPITNATSYTWTLPSGTTGTSSTNTITLNFSTSAISGNLTVKGVNSCGEGTLSSIAVTVNPLPTNVTAVASPNPICQDATLTLTGEGQNVVSWAWAGPPAFSATTQNASKICGLPGAGVYTLTVTNACGSVTASTLSVSVHPKPNNVIATASPNPVSIGQTLTLTGNGTNVEAWQWTGPNNFTSSLQNPTITNVTSTNAGVYTLTAWNICGSGTASTASVSVVSGASYYVSFSAGNDANNGLSASTPWKTFNNINARTFAANDKIYLKSGDTWNQELNLNGSGSVVEPIILTVYEGTAPANIWRSDKASHKSVVLNKPSNWKISYLDCRVGKIGLYLRYDVNETGQNITISNCSFKDFNSGVSDPALFNYEYAISAGIWIGGFVPASNPNYTVLENITVDNCGFETCDVGFGTNYYFPPIYYSRIKNVQFRDSYAFNCKAGAQHFFCVDGGLMTRVRSLNSGGNDPFGTTGGFLQSSKNYTVDNCEFAYTLRDNCPDGLGFDFEGDTHDCVFSNNVLHDNDGPGMLVMSSYNDHTNLRIENNTYYNNATDPYQSHYSEMDCPAIQNAGYITNCGYYKAVGVATYSANWDNFVKTGNRELAYSSISGLPTSWSFNTLGNLEGWNTFNEWTSNTVSNGFLNGVSGGYAYVQSPNIFVNSFQSNKIKIGMKQTAGTSGLLYYLTETDGSWNAAKSVPFTIISDGLMHEYIIDLKQSALKGVITKILINPTNVAGSNMAIDYIEFIY